MVPPAAVALVDRLKSTAPEEGAERKEADLWSETAFEVCAQPYHEVATVVEEQQVRTTMMARTIADRSWPFAQLNRSSTFGHRRGESAFEYQQKLSEALFLRYDQQGP